MSTDIVTGGLAYTPGGRDDVDPRLDDGTRISAGSRVWVAYEDSWAEVLSFDPFGVDVRIEEDGVQVSASWQQLFAEEQAPCGLHKNERSYIYRGIE